MIARRYAAVLGALTVVLGLLAAVCLQQAVEISARSFEPFYGTGPTTQDDYLPQYQLMVIGDALRSAVPWTLLAAVVAGVATLVLIALRARAQAGSASATASRDASAASARS